MISKVLVSAKLSSDHDSNASLSLAFYKLLMGPIQNMDDVLEELAYVICGNCVKENVCVGGCWIRALNQHGDIGAKDSMCICDMCRAW